VAQTPEGESDRVYECYPGDAVPKGAEVSDFLSSSSGGRQQSISCKKTAQGRSSLYQGEAGGTASLFIRAGDTRKDAAVGYSSPCRTLRGRVIVWLLGARCALGKLIVLPALRHLEWDELLGAARPALRARPVPWGVRAAGCLRTKALLLPGLDLF